jgi:polyferredoxin
VEEIELYEKRENIYQREVQGPWQRFRAVTLFALAGFYLILPWLTWEGRQAVWFDLPHRKFYLFGLTLWPQDFIYLSWLLIISAFSLFFFTALAGRLWCGYGCPQTVWTKFFMWIEWLTEGDRPQRMRLDKGPWTAEKVRRKALKHALWLGLSIVVGTTFVGYFVPIRDLVARMAVFNVSGTETFALLFFQLALYVDSGWFREQVCKYVCPYARFQGAMFDTSTLTIFYDPKRGEPRGRRAKGTDPAKLGLGECIDCGYCVQVCPTGIDIRNGTQYECIGCAACIDACNEVMDSVGYPKGLVRYDTEDVPLAVDIIRDRARLYRVTSDGMVENVYTLKIMNKDQRPHSYRIAADTDNGMTLAGPGEIHIASGEILDVPVRLRAPRVSLSGGSVPVGFRVESVDQPDIRVEEESRFLAPRKVAG